MAAGLIQTALFSFGLPVLSSRAAEIAANPPVPRVTDVAAQKPVSDVVLVSNSFAGFVAGSLADTVWAGFHTNGRSTNLWEVWLLLIRGPDVPGQGDDSIILFDADLPAGIEPMRVADSAKVRRKYLFGDLSHKPVFMALQQGNVSAGVAGWTVPIRGGDSGAPIMLPLPGELVFFGGISTSPPSAAMQADMDSLSRKAGLDPRRYQMQWVNLDGYPDF